LKRLTLFAKGNSDVHDSLHSYRESGVVRWNGVNEIVRERFPGASIRLRHETFTRSDALLEADGAAPDGLAAHRWALGAFPLASQCSKAVFETDADAIIFSAQPDTTTTMWRHKTSGRLFYPHDVAALAPAARAWLAAHYEQAGLLSAAQSMRFFGAIIERLRARTAAPILIYNVSATVPGETVHSLQGLGETFTTRIRRFNVMLAELSENTGISIIDVDSVLARRGMDQLKLSALHLTAEGHRIVAAEVVRVLADLGVLA
jgi:hypothetical protein